jgi:hypothetical protein
LLLEQEHAVKVREKMTANPACCSPEDTSEAAARIWSRKIVAAPVVENQSRGRHSQ